jgi:hypothetical protein
MLASNTWIYNSATPKQNRTNIYQYYNLVGFQCCIFLGGAIYGTKPIDGDLMAILDTLKKIFFKPVTRYAN